MRPNQRFALSNALAIRLAATLLFCLATIAEAVPYIPASGSQVIEHLPSRSDPVQQQFKRLRLQLAANPHDLALATGLAQRYIEQARNEGDPRYLGYAQAALSPWWGQTEPPVKVRLLRATLLQSTHQFHQALEDLNAVLKIERDNAQAWLTRATVLMVRGDYAQAKNSCEHLYPLAPALITQTCLTNIASLNGDAAPAYAQLLAVFKKHPEAEPDIQLWVLTLLAEMAARNGDSAAADSHFRAALAFDNADSYLLGAYADFLLDQQRPAEVVALLKSKPRVDALLLRYALALKATKSPEAAQQSDALRARFDAAVLRGDTVHQREQARFALQLQNDPKNALILAQRNWAVQKEPADVRILLEAAAAAKDTQAAQPLLAWLKQSRLQDQTLQPSLLALGAGK
ncbi:MAG: hypothetical protein V4805_14795 [Pseudomonadota bacterium]